MAIDANILLQGIVPDVAGAVGRGMQIGQSIKNAPILRRMKEQQLEQGKQAQQLNEQSIAQGNLKQGKGEAVALYNLYQDTPITAENYQQATQLAQKQGIPLREDDLIPSPENIQNLNRIIQAGKQFSQGSQRGSPAALRAVEGDFTFRDDNDVLFTQTTFMNPNTQEATAKLTDISGQGRQPVGNLTPVSNTGESINAKRQAEIQAKVDAEKKIQKVKTSVLPEAERNKIAGRERGKIEFGVKQAAQQSRRSKANLLRLKRGLEQVKTGRLAAARDIVGGMIPGVKDSDAEVFNSLASQFALDELSKQSGTKTDFDFKKAEETQARLGNTQEANERIIEIALDRFDEIEQEEKQFKEFLGTGGNAEDFNFKPVPPEHVDFVRTHADDKKIVADFKAKYGYLPTGL